MDTAAAGVLIETLEALAHATDLDGVTEVVARSARTLLNADGATFVLREDGMCFYADENAISPLWKGSRFPLTSCISGWAMLHKESVVVPDIYADSRIPQDAYRPTFVHSLSMVPIRAADPLGALGVYWSDHHVATPEEVRLQELLANSAAVAFENLELRGAVGRRSSERDELESALHTLVHDLRNPLGVVLGYSELIELAAEDTEKVVLFARTLQDVSRRMDKQIDHMLALYRITSHPFAPESVDLSDLAREVADDVALHERPRTITVDVADDLRAFADPVLIRLMLGNLIGNAAKFTRGADPAVITVGHAGPGSFYVSDNGVGFDPAEADHLFEPGVRLHDEADFPGTGLGLASIARIAALHGGTVAAASTPGEGATFTVTLPVE